MNGRSFKEGFEPGWHLIKNTGHGIAMNRLLKTRYNFWNFRSGTLDL